MENAVILNFMKFDDLRKTFMGNNQCLMIIYYMTLNVIYYKTR